MQLSWDTFSDDICFAVIRSKAQGFHPLLLGQKSGWEAFWSSSSKNHQAPTHAFARHPDRRGPSTTGHALPSLWGVVPHAGRLPPTSLSMTKISAPLFFEDPITRILQTLKLTLALTSFWKIFKTIYSYYSKNSLLPIKTSRIRRAHTVGIKIEYAKGAGFNNYKCWENKIVMAVSGLQGSFSNFFVFIFWLENTGELVRLLHVFLSIGNLGKAVIVDRSLFPTLCALFSKPFSWSSITQIIWSYRPDSKTPFLKPFIFGCSLKLDLPFYSFLCCLLDEFVFLDSNLLDNVLFGDISCTENAKKYPTWSKDPSFPVWTFVQLTTLQCQPSIFLEIF